MSKIDGLTPEQQAKIPEYLEKYHRIGLSTEPCDRAKAEHYITQSYLNMSLQPPKFEWYDSPKQGARRAASMANTPLGQEYIEPTTEQIRDQAGKASYGSFEAYWVAYFDFIATELPVPKYPLIDIVKGIVVGCGVYWTFEDTVVITEKPIGIHMKNDKLHNPDGLALEYKDGSGIYSYDGVRYPSLLEMKIAVSAIKDNDYEGGDEA